MFFRVLRPVLYFDVPRLPLLRCPDRDTLLSPSPCLHRLRQKLVSSVYPPAQTLVLDFSFCAMKIMVVFSFFNYKNIILSMFSQTTYCFHVPPGEFDLLQENHYARNLMQVKFWKGSLWKDHARDLRKARGQLLPTDQKDKVGQMMQFWVIIGFSQTCFPPNPFMD